MKRKNLEKIVNALTLIFVIIGLVVMFNFNSDDNELVSHGVENFKYFTVLSNVFCGIVAFSSLNFDILSIITNKEYEGMDSRFKLMKLISTSAVGLTFFTIALFLWPIYRLQGMYSGSNLFFHLFVPVLAMIDFALIDGGEKIPFRYTFFAMTPSIIYGTFYLANILINGKGEWPYTNDWYGYLNWGYPVGALIFAVSSLVTWLVACVLRLISNKNIKNI
ncbi:MAG: Pr6Pr family membrane protein [Lachnospiraceae bacterium]|nr:Pr6Pr family membrane protein [Lachnospiraceae bacterium]